MITDFKVWCEKNDISWHTINDAELLQKENLQKLWDDRQDIIDRLTFRDVKNPITLDDNYQKPCPFCGADGEVDSAYGAALASCTNRDCHLGFVMQDEPWCDEVLKLWNRRPREEYLEKQLNDAKALMRFSLPDAPNFDNSYTPFINLMEAYRVFLSRDN